MSLTCTSSVLHLPNSLISWTSGATTTGAASSAAPQSSDMMVLLKNHQPSMRHDIYKYMWKSYSPTSNKRCPSFYYLQMIHFVLRSVSHCFTVPGCKVHGENGYLLTNNFVNHTIKLRKFCKHQTSPYRHLSNADTSLLRTASYIPIMTVVQNFRM